ncbi:MAG: type IV pilus secretin PilQ family protein [Halothiobacillaceae bacterium]|nr:type IV pilus secretin PilQ family protein [Halothiobacillaceae bacterium]
MSSAWAANTIRDVNVDLLTDGSTQIRFIMAEPMQSAPSNFVIEEPARIALDFPDTRFDAAKKLRTIEIGNVHDVRFAESQGRARAIVSLGHSTPYNISVAGNDVILAIQNVDVSNTAPSSASETASSPTPAANTQDTAHTAAVPQVDFKMGVKGEGRILVNMPSANAPMNMKTEGKRLIIDMPSTQLKEGQYDVSDFATPAQTVTVENKGQGSRLTVENNVAFENMAYQVGKQLTIEIRPVPAPDANRNNPLAPKSFTGERLTLKFQDIEVRPLLQLLADFTNQNIVVSDSVQGKMSLRLDNVPWDQALDLILTTRGLAMRQNGNVMFIAPVAEIAAQEKARLDLIRQNETLAPLVSDFIQINYARAQDIEKLLRPSKTGSNVGSLGGAAVATNHGFLSPRGTITVDERTNTLLVNDIADNLQRIRDLVKKLDSPIKQVLIETRIVIATDNFARELGVKWGVTGVNTGSNGTAVYTGNNTGTNGMITNVANGSAPGFPSDVSNRYNINLPVTNPMGTLGLSILGSNVLVDMEISAMQAEGQGEIISSPRVLTANGQAAYIKQGKEIPYQEASSSGATTTSFKEAVLQTIVTPQITPNNNVIMDIKVQKDEPDWTRSVNGVPPLDKREVNTKVQVNNGETVVLGGIYEISNVNQLDKIPFLGDIPWIGRALFSKTLKSTQKFELLIFVTPRIVENGMMAEVQNVQ